MKKRLTYLDLMKVIAMCMVVLSHVLQRQIKGVVPTIWFNIFYSVHMSMFMFVSGFLIKKCESIKEYFKYIVKMIISYLLPSILFTILTVTTLPRYKDHNVLFWLKEFVVRTDSFYWYMIVAFVLNSILSLAYYLTHKIQLKTTIKVICAIVVFAIFTVPFYFIAYSNLPGLLSSNLMIYLIPAFILGFIVSYIEKHLFRQCVLIPLLSISVIGYLTILILRPNFVTFENNIDFLTHQIGSLFGTIMYYYICVFLTKHKTFEQLSLFGKYSMPLYLIHVYLIRIITPYVNQLSEYNFYSISFLLVYMITFTVGSLFITILLCKNKYVDLILFGNIKRVLDAKK